MSTMVPEKYNLDLGVLKAICDAKSDTKVGTKNKLIVSLSARNTILFIPGMAHQYTSLNLAIVVL